MQYIKIIEECVVSCVLENPGTEESLLWDTIKCRIRGVSIKYSSKLKRERNKRINELEDKLAMLEKSLPGKTDKVAEICARDIKDIENELEIYIQQKAMGVKIRSKTMYYEQGEKSTRYFHSLEKKNQEDKNIKLLINDNGEKILGVKNILNEEVLF